MPVRIRLQRHGKKGKPFYWIVAADSRSKRDGKFLEKLGIYNPNTNPATIDINVDNSVKWLQNGAQPSDTARRILSYKGVLLKKHLLGGLAKGALTEEQVEAKFQAWVDEKEKTIAKKTEGLAKAKAEAKAKALAAEKEASDKRLMAAAGEVAEEETAEVAEGAEEGLLEGRDDGQQEADLELAQGAGAGAPDVPGKVVPEAPPCDEVDVEGVGVPEEELHEPRLVLVRAA